MAKGKGAAREPQTERQVVARNRRAFHRYVILDKREAGIVLTGPEVKTLRGGKCDLADSYARIRDHTVWLINLEIPAYGPAAFTAHVPRRNRKLLLHHDEIHRLAGRLDEKGTTLVPLSVYFTHGLAKVELALARGAREFDKREREREQEAKREIKQRMARHKAR